MAKMYDSLGALKVATGVSVDDTTTDAVYTFTARGEVAWRTDKHVRREVRRVLVPKKGD